MTDVAFVPGPPALLDQYRSQVDPLPEVRAVARAAVAWLHERSDELLVVTGSAPTGDPTARPTLPPGLRIARELLAGLPPRPVTEVVVGPDAAVPRPGRGCGVLVVADGSARRSLKAPGHLDDRAVGFDDEVEAALVSGDPARFTTLDGDLADELLCAAVPVLAGVAGALAGQRARAVELDLSADPFGVQYWVVRWPDVS
jgi:hypothetical protein